ncbi:hypothetical protein PAMP_007180 [Pampus punctatissimus]
MAKKNQNKEMVILRDGKAISSHFPCCLIKKERLIVNYVKAVDNMKKVARGPGLLRRKGPRGELVMFHVLTKGGKKVVKIMRNLAIQAKYQEITVYAYKGENVKQALKRDGRFLSIVFKKNCALSHTSTEVNTEMSNLVDDLDGKTFKIILLSRSSPLESQPGSLDDDYMVQSESRRTDSDENQTLSEQSTTTQSVNDDAKKNIHEIPNSETMVQHLSSEFKGVVNQMKNGPKLSRVQNRFHVEFGKNAQMLAEVKTMKKLMQLSDSVCQVRIDGCAEGSGFLLFDKFVLTNGHVVKNFYHASKGQLEERLTVHFSYESIDQMEGEQQSGAKVVVEEIVAADYSYDVSGNMCDWALLRLRADQALPNGLLKHFGFLPQCGGICIIGHPDGGVKKYDPCFVIPSHERNQIMEKHNLENPGDEGVESFFGVSNIQMVTRNFFECLPYLTYETCFYFGSSGSPVFDKHCNVVAIHTGGYPYQNAKGRDPTVIEYGQPLSIIIECIIVQIVEKGRLDVLKEYLACDYAQHQNIMTGLKKLVESRNLTAFKNASNKSVDADDERLKMFFQFFSQTEDPVPMDISSD